MMRGDGPTVDPTALVTKLLNILSVYGLGGAGLDVVSGGLQDMAISSHLQGGIQRGGKAPRAFLQPDGDLKTYPTVRLNAGEARRRA